MTNQEPRETRVIHQSHTDAEQKSLLTDVVVPVAQTTIQTGGAIVGAAVVAKITTGKGDGKK